MATLSREEAAERVVALLSAARDGDLHRVQELLRSGVPVDARDMTNRHGWTALIMAAFWGRIPVVQHLVDAGADVDAVDNYDKTALMYAAEFGNMSVVRFLVGIGANVNKATGSGQTAVFFAASKGESDIQRYLTTLLEHSQGNEDSSPRTELALKSSQSQSWFISPFEIELVALDGTQTTGIQFRAKWLDADVVVKLFVPGASMTTFANEVTVWRQLRHPNVIKLYGACDVGHYFFVSEFASNGSLVDYLAACRRDGVKCTPWKFLHEAALGLAFLHERRIIHGNLRGSNILIGSDGVAKLANFTLSGGTGASFHTVMYSDQRAGNHLSVYGAREQLLPLTCTRWGSASLRL